MRRILAGLAVVGALVAGGCEAERDAAGVGDPGEGALAEDELLEEEEGIAPRAENEAETFHGEGVERPLEYEED